MQMDCQLRIAICDDEQADRTRIEGLTQEFLVNAKIGHSISVYTSGDQLLAAVAAGEPFDIMLLDVMMGDMNGIELARQLRGYNNKAVIIFISGNREMAMYGYEVEAVRYLAKPVDENKLDEALRYCCKVWQERKIILLPTERGQEWLNVRDILVAEAFDRGTRFVLADETITIRAKFSEMEAVLPKSVFVQCHRAYVVNLAHIRRIRSNAFEMKNGMTVPISRHRYEVVSRKFVEYISN